MKRQVIVPPAEKQPGCYSTPSSGKLPLAKMPRLYIHYPLKDTKSVEGIILEMKNLSTKHGCRHV